MTDAELDEIERRAAATRRGPWTADEDLSPGEDKYALWAARGTNPCYPREQPCVGDVYLPAERDFIAAARSDVPALVAEVRRLRAAQAELHAAAGDFFLALMPHAPIPSPPEATSAVERMYEALRIVNPGEGWAPPEEVRRLRAIVEVVAKMDPRVYRVDSYFFCILCRREEHDPSCPWLAARAAVK